MKETIQTSQNGNVRKKGNQWYYRFRMQEEDGTWKHHEFKGRKNKRETEAMLRQALADYRMNGFVYEPADITVNELGELWYQDEIEYSALTTNARNGYRNVLRHMIYHSH